MNKVLILDTSILCVWLQVPGKETCGPEHNRWTYDLVKAKIDAEIEQGTTLILPLAAIIETGNHIAQAPGDKHGIVNSFADHIEKAIDGKVPWAAFTKQSQLIGSEAFKETIAEWRKTALAGQSLGDAMIVAVANYYSRFGTCSAVEIFTGDEGLKAYEPTVQSPRPIPRRRR